MNDISIVALFCEDIREEKAGTNTLVGVLPDNMRVPEGHGIFPKMCIYVRTNIRLDFDVGPLVIRIIAPGGKELSRSEATAAIVADARAKARIKGTPYVGLVTKFVIAPLEVTEPGRFQAVVTISGREYVAGSLNLEVAPHGAT